MRRVSDIRNSRRLTANMPCGHFREQRYRATELRERMDGCGAERLQFLVIDHRFIDLYSSIRKPREHVAGDMSPSRIKQSTRIRGGDQIQKRLRRAIRYADLETKPAGSGSCPRSHAKGRNIPLN